MVHRLFVGLGGRGAIPVRGHRCVVEVVVGRSWLFRCICIRTVLCSIVVHERGACEHEALVSVVRYDTGQRYYFLLLCFECAVDRGHRQTDRHSKRE